MPAKKKKDAKIDAEYLRQKLKLQSLAEKADFARKHAEAEKYLRSKGVELGKVRQHSAKLLGAGALAGTLLLAPVAKSGKLPSPHLITASLSEKLGASQHSAQELVMDALEKALPERPRPLVREEEKYLERVFEEVVGVKARATLEGEHLNTTYGYIGAEQHLRRYPGDTLAQHAPEGEEYGAEDPQEVLREGIAPGLGAWGYFAPSKEEFAPDLEETERWYAVVQTLYLPDWNERVEYLRDWYKYRKVLIVNTENGKAVVASIADSGPAAWTGKQFGGSPEVMDYLGGASYKKGPVVVFFVDDPDNTVPLGPVEYNNLYE